MTEPMSRLRRFAAELKRRRVLRVAAAYAVVAWILLEVASVLGPALRLPDWTVTLVAFLVILGFPFAVVLAWAFDLTPDGVERTSHGAAGTESASRGVRAPAAAAGDDVGRRLMPRHASAYLVIGFLIAVGGLGMYGWVGSSGGAASGSAGAVSRTAVAVLPFEADSAGEVAYLKEGIVKLLGTKLNGAAGLRSVDAHTLLTFLEGRPGQIGPDEGRRIAERFGAGLYILGGVMEVGDRVHLEAGLYDPASGRGPAVRASVEGAADSVFDLVDELAARLLAGRLESTGAALASSAALTTRSIPALRAYLEGEAHLRAAESGQAVAAFQRATAEDSTFALAWYRLAEAAGWGERFQDLQLPAIRAALQHADRLTPRDRALVEGLDAFFRGDWAAAEAGYRRLVTQYPDNVDAWYNLGETLFHGNAWRGRPQSEAREAFERAMALDPENREYMIHPVQLMMVEGRYAAADSLMRRAGEIPDTATGPSAARILELATGDEEDRRQALDALRTANLRQAFGAVYEHLRFAPVPGAFIDSAVATLRPRLPTEAPFLMMAWDRGRASTLDRLTQWAPPGEAVLLLRAWYASSPALAMPLGDVARIRAEIEAWVPPEQPDSARPNHQDPFAGVEPQVREYLLGMLAIRQDDVVAATRSAGRLERAAENGGEAAFFRRLAAELRARVARRDDGPAAALRILEVAAREPYPVSLYPSGWLLELVHERWLRAELLNELGRDRAALRWYATFQERGYGYGDFIYYALSHLRQAEIHDRTGDREAAKEHYGRFVEFWDGADPHLLPMVEGARDRLGHLAAEDAT